MTNLCMGEGFCEELTCAVCLDSWKDPIELSPCGHIFCRACATGLTECPVCRDRIESTRQPNRTLVNMALQIRVKCIRCGWQGTREQGMHHVCGNTNSSSIGGGQALPIPSSAAASPPPIQGFDKANVAPGVGAASNPDANYGEYGTDYGDLWTTGAPVQQPTTLTPPPMHPQVVEVSGPRPWTLYGLSQEEYDQIVSLFVFFDDDDSGTLERNEVARLALWLNFAQSPQDVQRIFDDMDADHSGSLTLAEFLSWLHYNKPNPQALYDLTPSQYNTIMMQFRMYDRNQDGRLDAEEFVRLVQNLREVRDAMTGRQLFQMIDRDHDGAITLHDFLSFRAGRM